MVEHAFNTAGATQSPCLRIAPARPVPTLHDDVRSGLLSPPRALPPKYFYDDLGAELFERICDTEEYYPTRTEEALLREHSGSIIELTRPDQILELGSGSSRKTRRLFEACEQNGRRCTYLPFDVCEPALEQAARELTGDFPWLGVTPLAGDYHAGLDNLPERQGTTLFVFLGSTIGNFSRDEARRFILEVYQCMQDGDWFLLGADRLKDPAVLKAAYNDNSGVTAEFNLNLLRVLNRELRADFVPAGFEHEAVFNRRESRIEMYLRSRQRQSVCLRDLDETVELEEGERILTELSHKFRYEQLQTLLGECGLETVRHYQPANEYFSLLLARRAA